MIQGVLIPCLLFALSDEAGAQQLPASFATFKPDQDMNYGSSFYERLWKMRDLKR